MDTSLKGYRWLGILAGAATLGFAAVASANDFVIPPGNGVLAPLHTTKTVRISQFVDAVDRILTQAQMRLHNHKQQGSFVALGSRRLDFQVPRAVVDIDCGTFCPDLGDGHFYLNDINLRRADFASVNVPVFGQSFRLKFEFEDSGREIKGYHNKFGDDWMPDFNMRGVALSLRANLAVQNGALAMRFSSPHLSADIQSTGGCSPAGIDVCNKLFGTDRKIQKAAEQAALGALNGPLVQLALRLGLAEALRTLGIEGRVIGVRLQGSDILITVE